MDLSGVPVVDCTYCWCSPCICGRYDAAGRPRDYPVFTSFHADSSADFIAPPESKEDRILRLLEEIGKLIREK